MVFRMMSVYVAQRGGNFLSESVIKSDWFMPYSSVDVLSFSTFSTKLAEAHHNHYANTIKIYTDALIDFG